ncbi:hypothetical protein KAU32_09850 [bacterium]|nr:hypothetical protein [bacterium]
MKKAFIMVMCIIALTSYAHIKWAPVQYQDYVFCVEEGQGSVIGFKDMYLLGTYLTRYGEQIISNLEIVEENDEFEIIFLSNCEGKYYYNVLDDDFDLIFQMLLAGVQSVDSDIQLFDDYNNNQRLEFGFLSGSKFQVYEDILNPCIVQEIDIPILNPSVESTIGLFSGDTSYWLLFLSQTGNLTIYSSSSTGFNCNSDLDQDLNSSIKEITGVFDYNGDGNKDISVITENFQTEIFVNNQGQFELIAYNGPTFTDVSSVSSAIWQMGLDKSIWSSLDDVFSSPFLSTSHLGTTPIYTNNNSKIYEISNNERSIAGEFHHVPSDSFRIIKFELNRNYYSHKYAEITFSTSFYSKSEARLQIHLKDLNGIVIETYYSSFSAKPFNDYLLEGTITTETIPEGEYLIEIIYEDLQGNMLASQVKEIEINTIDVNIVVSSDVLSPNDDNCNEMINFDACVGNLTLISPWIFKIKNIDGTIVFSEVVSSDEVVISWDGRDQYGNIYPDGEYFYHIDVVDIYSIASKSLSGRFKIETGTKVAISGIERVEFESNSYAFQPFIKGSQLYYFEYSGGCKCSVAQIPGNTCPYDLSENSGIYRLNTDGTNYYQLVSSIPRPSVLPPYSSWNPSPTKFNKISKSGKYVAFLRSFNIHIVDTENSNISILPDIVWGDDFVWAGNSDTLAYIYRNDENKTVIKCYDVNSASTIWQFEIFGYIYGIDWSDDGTLLAFHGTARDSIAEPSNRIQILIMPDGSQNQYYIDEYSTIECINTCWQPVISHDSSAIAFLDADSFSLGVKVAYLDPYGEYAQTIELTRFPNSNYDSVMLMDWDNNSRYIYYSGGNFIEGTDCRFAFSLREDPFGNTQPKLLPGTPDYMNISLGRVDSMGGEDDLFANNILSVSDSNGIPSFPFYSYSENKIIISQYISENRADLNIISLTEYSECQNIAGNVPGNVENIESNVIATVNENDILSTFDTLMISSVPQQSIPSEGTNQDDIEPILSNVYDIRLLSGQEYFTDFIEIAFTYSDEKVQGLDESKLQVWAYNTDSNMWHVAQPDETRVHRDTVSNVLTVEIQSLEGYYVLSGYFGDYTQPEIADLSISSYYLSPDSNNCLDFIEITFSVSEFSLIDLAVISDSGEEVFKTQFYSNVDGISSHIWDASSNIGETLPDGLYAFKLQGTDVEGLQSEFYYSQFMIDTVAPISNIDIEGSQYINNGLTYISEDSNISISAFDSGLYQSGVNKIEYSINNSESLEYTSAISGSEFDQSDITLSFLSIDSACNREISETQMFIVDQTAPHVSLAYSPFRQIENNTLVYLGTFFTFSGSDSQSGVKYYQYRIESVSDQNDTGWMNYLDAFTLPFSAPGRYIISYKTTDNVDNESEVYIKEVILAPAVETSVNGTAFERVLILNGEGAQDLDNFMLLNNLADHAIVDNINDFVDEMRTGRFNVYWINEKDDNLPGHTAEEMREHVYSGFGLISSGYIHMISEGGSPGMFNLKSIGEYPENDYFIDITDTSISSAGIIPIEGWVQRLELLGISSNLVSVGTISVSNNPASPVITLNPYGWGKTAYYGFDLLYNAVNVNLSEIVSDNIRAITPGIPEEHLPGMVIALETKVIADITVPIRITEILPENVEIIKVYDGGVVEDGSITFEFPEGKKEVTVKYLIRLPDYSGELNFITRTSYKATVIWFDTEEIERTIYMAMDISEIKAAISEILYEISIETEYSNRIRKAIKTFEGLDDSFVNIEELDKAILDIVKTINNLVAIEDIDTDRSRRLLDGLLLYYESMYKEVTK